MFMLGTCLPQKFWIVLGPDRLNSMDGHPYVFFIVLTSEMRGLWLFAYFVD